VLAGDLPFVAPRLMRKLADVGVGADAVVPRLNDRWHPLCAAYRRRVAPTIQARLQRGELRVSGALTHMRVRAVEVDELAAIEVDETVLMNVNSPDDLRRAERRARLRS
jgi:molybdenum cofactor guanylyltransferase